MEDGPPASDPFIPEHSLRSSIIQAASTSGTGEGGSKLSTPSQERRGGGGRVPQPSPLTLKRPLYRKTKINPSCSDLRRLAPGKPARSRQQFSGTDGLEGGEDSAHHLPRPPQHSDHPLPNKTKAKFRSTDLREAGWQSALGSTLSSFVLLTTPACRWELSRWRRRRQRRRPRLPRPEPPSDSAPGAANSSAPHSADPASSALPCPMATRGPPRRPPIGGCLPLTLRAPPAGSWVSLSRPYPPETVGVNAQPSGTCSPLRTWSRLIPEGNQRWTAFSRVH